MSAQWHAQTQGFGVVVDTPNGLPTAAALAASYNTDGSFAGWVDPSGGGGHVIEDDTVPFTQRAALNFEGAGVVVSDDVGNDATIVTIAGGAGGTPGGADTQVQFNDGGAFGGSPNMTWNGQSLTINGGADLIDTTETTFTIVSSFTTGAQFSVRSSAIGGEEWRLISAADGSQIQAGSFGVFSVANGGYPLVVKGASTSGSNAFVGVGINNPLFPIDVNGSDLSGITARLNSSDAFATGLLLENNGVGGRKYIINSTANGASSGGGKVAIFDLTASQYRTVLTDSSGRMGINQINPAAQLDILAAANTSGLQITPNASPGAHINLAASTAPGAPADGDIWNDGTDLFVRLAGVTYTLQKA